MSPRSRVLRTWEHRGLRCAVLAMDAGHGCGYVAVPEGHPWHGLDWDDPVPAPKPLPDDMTVAEAMEGFGPVNLLASDRESLAMQVRVHGGLTFAAEGLVGVEGGSWWLGFDCAHAGDARNPEWMSEGYRQIEAEFPSIPGDRIWTEEMIAAETERLADQIADAAPSDEGGES